MIATKNRHTWVSVTKKFKPNGPFHKRKTNPVAGSASCMYSLELLRKDAKCDDRFDLKKHRTWEDRFYFEIFPYVACENELSMKRVWICHQNKLLFITSDLQGEAFRLLQWLWGEPKRIFLHNTNENIRCGWEDYWSLESHLSPAAQRTAVSLWDSIIMCPQIRGLIRPSLGHSAIMRWWLPNKSNRGSLIAYPLIASDGCKEM